MLFPPPPGLCLLAYQFGSVSKEECMRLIKMWNEKRKKNKDGYIDHEYKTTCDDCRHLYYNCDGSVGCASTYEKACLKSNDRKFKETVAR